VLRRYYASENVTVPKIINYNPMALFGNYSNASSAPQFILPFQILTLPFLIANVSYAAFLLYTHFNTIIYATFFLLLFSIDKRAGKELQISHCSLRAYSMNKITITEIICIYISFLHLTIIQFEREKKTIYIYIYIYIQERRKIKEKKLKFTLRTTRILLLNYIVILAFAISIYSY
jgi:hypothetical protein